MCLVRENGAAMTERGAIAVAPRTLPHALFHVHVLRRETNVPSQRQKGHFGGRTGRPRGGFNAARRPNIRALTAVPGLYVAPWPPGRVPFQLQLAQGSSLPKTYTGSSIFISSTENKLRSTQKRSALEDERGRGCLTRVLYSSHRLARPKAHSHRP